MRNSSAVRKWRVVCAIIKLRRAARSMGVAVTRTSAEDEDACIYTRAGNVRIEIYARHSARRALYTLAHEMGHAAVPVLQRAGWAEERARLPRWMAIRLQAQAEISAWESGRKYIPAELLREYESYGQHCLRTYGAPRGALVTNR